jgi:hypothetical protein
MKKEEGLEHLLKLNKKKKELIGNDVKDPYVELHAILMQNEK